MDNIIKSKSDIIKELEVKREILLNNRKDAIKKFNSEKKRISKEYFNIECLALQIINNVSLGSYVIYVENNHKKDDTFIHGTLENISICTVFSLYEFHILDGNKKLHKIRMTMDEAIKSIKLSGRPISLSKILQNKL